jgi:hypothetical protein
MVLNTNELLVSCSIISAPEGVAQYEIAIISEE